MPVKRHEEAAIRGSSLFIEGQEPREKDGFYNFEVNLDSKHPILRGHFPGMPVVPGVMQLALVRHCAEKITGYSLQWAEIDKAKFFTPWTPETGPAACIRLKVTYNEFRKCWHVEAFVYRDATNFLSVKGFLKTC
jgi:3-hydroxymyristoyl/3-hydroxydecanoyl-(acyl carrier protein) dehydratase